MPKKKILIFIDWFLPGTKSGGPVRSIANLVEHLKEEADFWVITRNIDYCETEPYKNIRSDEWNQLEEHLTVFYISEKKLNKNSLIELLKSTDFDIAYINGIYSKYFSILPVYLLRTLQKPVIVAARGMLNSQAFSVKPTKKKVFLSLMNLMKFYRNVDFHATNEDEANFIAGSIKNYRTIKIAPNLPRKITLGEHFRKEKEDQVRYISVARVAKEKGTLTALKAFSQMRTEQKVIYDIFGPVYDQEYWEECRKVIEKLPGNIEVNYKGGIAGEQVPLLMKNYHFFIMPSEGENFGHGILEALTAGCPVIISDKTPWNALKVKEIGWDCSLGSDELESALLEATAMDPDTYNRWSASAYNFAKEYCNDQKPIEASRKLFF